jgi:hypothetical protein
LLTIIHKDRRKTGLRAGVVTDSEGRVLGRVERTYRQTPKPGGYFWTASVGLQANPDDRRYGSGFSLGTRYRSRAAATRALRDFWAWYEHEPFLLNPRPTYSGYDEYAWRSWYNATYKPFAKKVHEFLLTYDRGFPYRNTVRSFA